MNITVNLADTTAFGKILLATISLALNYTLYPQETRPVGVRFWLPRPTVRFAVLWGNSTRTQAYKAGWYTDSSGERQWIQMLDTDSCGFIISFDDVAPENIIFDDEDNI